MNQELIFTTLPHRNLERKGKRYLKLSVYISPYLKSPSDITLADAADMFHWAEIVRNTDFVFRISGRDGDIPAAFDKRQIDVDLYREIFYKDIKIEKYKTEDLNQKPIQSFPVRHVQDFLLKQVQTFAVKSPKQLLSVTDFIDPKGLGAISNVSINPKAADEAAAEDVEVEEEQVGQMKIKSFVQKNITVRDSLRNTLKRNRFIAYNKEMKPKEDFIQLVDFHRPELSKKVKPFVVKKPEFEFHNVLSVMSAFPELMRRLGFILDFEIPYDSSFPERGTIRVVPLNLSFEEEDTKVSLPLTAYCLTFKGFFAADKENSVLKNGFVKINTPEFSVVQMDTDGMALKTARTVEEKTSVVADFLEQKSTIKIKVNETLKAMKVGNFDAVKMSGLKGNSTYPKGVVSESSKKVLNKSISSYQQMRLITKMKMMDPPERGGLGTTRSAGIALIRNGMSEQVVEKINRNSHFQNLLIDRAKNDLTHQFLRLPEEVLYSDDLVMAYRMDIAYEEEPTKWYSLHQRKMNYSWFDSSGNEHVVENVEPDEGYVELGIVEKEKVDDRLFIPETLARWEGWSLSVGRPGLAINDSEEHPDPIPEKRHDFVHTSRSLELRKYQFDPTLDFRLNAQSDLVPGTLPKLRFGKSYRLRVRFVDMAGNSCSLESESESPAETYCSRIKYMRYEPLTSPITLVGNQLRDGESLERMVIRSNYNAGVKQYEKKNKVNEQDADGLSLRYLLPPKNSQLMAETHGCFEKAFGNPKHAKEIYNIITSHEGLYQPGPDNKERIYSESEAKVIYLPDPMAAGIAIFADTECADTHTQDFEPRMFSYFTKEEIMPDRTNSVPLPEDWYNAQAIILKLEEGEKLEGDWNAKNKRFIIRLPKGERLKVKISTFWREEDLKELSALWQILRDNAGAQKDSIEKTILSGQHWMISPSRTFELVHALQQPLEAPVIQKIIPERDYGDTSAQLNARFSIHGESTLLTELQASWTELHDDGISVEIKKKEFRDSISEIDILYHDRIISIGNVPDFRPDLNQNNLRVHAGLWKTQPQQLKKFDVQPGSVRISNLYKDQASKMITVEKQKKSASLNLIDKLNLVFIENSLNLVKMLDVRNFPIEHAFGNTRHRWVDYSFVASSRYSEYFSAIKKEKEDLSFTRESEPERLNILSTARPAKPEVDYVIPAFEWQKTEHGNVMKHIRKGGVLRVYLKRPWFSSGDDEKLAVILSEDSHKSKINHVSGYTAGYTDYYTHWGSDPLFITEGPSTYGPVPSDFRRNPTVDKGLSYPDREGKKATAVAYPVVFDREKQMWYADIALNTANMYFPFIKLALARYQEHSLRLNQTDVCLSPVVMSTMIQMVPERTASIELRPKANNMAFIFKLAGPTYNHSSSDAGAVIRITILDVQDNMPVEGVFINKEPDDAMKTVGFDLSRRQFAIGRYMKGNYYFDMSEEIVLPEKYKKRPFDVIIEEVEYPMISIPGIAPKYQERLYNSGETERVVYADQFRIGE